MRHTECSNCGSIISKIAIDLAIDDARIPEQDLAFCCASYNADGICTGEHDDNDMAYWYSI